MKKLINDVAAVVPQMLTGLAGLNPGLSLLQGGNIVIRSDAQEPAALAQVALISGGGAGHEPAHGGYVGPGMLSAAVAGEVFTSPSTDAVLDAIRAVAGPRGVLLIVKNYTGDRLNFSLAAEIARSEGIEAEVVIVADDVALSAGGPHAGRRGLAGTVLIHKIAGAAAAEGRALGDVAAAARSAASSLGTMGVALGSCTVPAAGKPGFQLADDEIEWGLGIHGEPGVRRTRMQPADDIVAELLAQIIDDLSLQPGSRVALLVNNMGGSAASELNIVAGSALRYLRSQQITVERAWSGAFLTALEMAGCSLSLLAVDDQRVAWLDAPTLTTAWPGHLGKVADVVEQVAPSAPSGSTGAVLSSTSTLHHVISAVCDCLLAADSELTEMDQLVGDGDLGISLSRAAHAILDEIDSYPSESDPGAVLREMSATIQRVVGGTSGPLYAVMLLRAAAVLAGSAQPSAKDWSTAFTAGVTGIMDVGGARRGDRTMVDALLPAEQALAEGVTRSADQATLLSAMVEAATASTEHTATLTARLGRSSYVGDRALGVPDPGAHAVSLWLAAIRDALQTSNRISSP